MVVLAETVVRSPGAVVLILILLAAVVSGGIGYACGAGRDRGAAGFILGLWLGPLGWIIALLLPANLPRDEYRGRCHR